MTDSMHKAMFALQVEIFKILLMVLPKLTINIDDQQIQPNNQQYIFNMI